MMRISLLLGCCALVAAPLGAESCRLCAPETERLSEGGRARVPLSIVIETALDMGRVAQGDTGGAVEIDAQTGSRRVGGTLTDLGGMALRGTALVTGAFYARVRIDLPMRVQLRSTTGEIAEVAEFRTDLSPHPALDADGRLTFSFGGRLVLKGGESGSFRGNVPISAEYE